LARAGRPTASCFSKIITPKTLKPSASAENYLYQLAGERIAGCKADTFQSAAMERGVEMEAEARSYFEFYHDVQVDQVGLVYPNSDKLFSCSPDGLLPNVGLEIKCPLIHTHIAYLLKNELPTEYILQVQGSMLVTGFDYWWFLSYYPGLPPLTLLVKRDESICKKLDMTLMDFCVELDKVESQLRGMQ